MTTSATPVPARQGGDLVLRVRWFAVTVPVYTFAAAAAGALGEVVGEAWGGAFLHQLGHALGTALLVWLLVVAGWLVLRGRVAWAAPWAIAGAVGCFLGLVLYLPILWAATDEEVTIGLSLFLPLAAAAVAQARALRHVPGSRWWAASWFLAIVLGVGVAWYVGGGLAGAAAGWPYPVFEKAVAYWWRMVPRNLLGGVLFASWTALAVPLAGGPSQASS